MENLEDVDLLEHKLRNLNGDINRTLVDLKLSGALSLADLQHFEERIVEGAAAALFHLRIDRQRLFRNPPTTTSTELIRAGLCALLLTNFEPSIEAESSDADLARAALHRLYIEHKKLESGKRMKLRRAHCEPVQAVHSADTIG